MLKRLYSHLQWTSEPGIRKHLTYRSDEKNASYPHYDSRLTPHDEAIFLLHIGAEVEHALMVQYLYAAYSLGGAQVPEEHAAEVIQWQKDILIVAREEMGHLVTVQNLLHLIGGPLTLDREDFPSPTDLYPFSFTLEPLTKKSLGKYVLAEMPDDEALKNKPEMKKIVDEIKSRIDVDGYKVNRVGKIYERVLKLFDALPVSAFRKDSVPFQANADTWGLGLTDMLIETAADKAAAIAGLKKIAEQGEGASVDFSKGAALSHFERFLNIYKNFPDSNSGWKPTKNVPVNPCTNDAREDSTEKELEKRIITNPLTRLWAHLSNQRYRMVLLYLNHALHTQSNSDATQGLGLLVSWTFREMYNLRSLSGILTTMPQFENGDLHHVAASPFEMPYSVELPNREVDRWRSHRDQILTGKLIMDEIISIAGNNREHLKYLEALKTADAKALKSIQEMIKD